MSKLALLVMVLSGCVPETGDNIDPADNVDPAGGSGSGGGSSSGGARGVFLTRGAYNGDLRSYVPGASDGLVAGDELCQVRASAAGLAGTWVAWLSSSQIDAIDRVLGNGPWQLVGGGIAFQNRAQLQL